MSGTDWQAWEVRLERLERQNRRWQAFGLVMLGVATCVGLVAADKKPAKMEPVDASALRIWDDAGHLRAVLASAPSGNAALALLDEDGKVCATLGVAKGGSPGLEMCSHNRKVRMRLEAREDGRPVLQFVDAKGHVTAPYVHDEAPDDEPTQIADQPVRGSAGGR